jgi:hypothetical protein
MEATCNMGQAKLTTRQLAEHWRVDQRTIRRYIRAGLPHVGSRRTLRFNLEKAEAWRASTIAPHMPRTGLPAAREEARLTCIQCQDHAGYTLEEARTLESPDPSRFCWPKCAEDFAAGKSTAETRKQFARSMVASGWTKRELELDGYWTWLL